MLAAHVATLSPPAVSDAAAQTPTRNVALTYDDLPFYYSASEPSAARARALRSSRQLQRALMRHRAPATGFVNEVKLQELGEVGITILREWNRGIFELANHSFSHTDSNILTIGEIEQEILRGQRVTKSIVEAAGRSLQFFRFPYNHTGDTDEKRVGIERLLARHGYTMAASTIDTSDYLFAKAYDRAVMDNDRAIRRRVEQAYLDHTEQQIQYYSDLNAKVLGHHPKEVALLHLNTLNAVTADRMLKIYRRLGYRFVSLREAQSDPAYRTPPAFPTKFGPMWAYRWAHERGIKVNRSLEKEPPSWVEAYAK
ncbi:MAG: polysaccharide deacetylase family protein [Sphingomonas sp.]